MGKRKRKLSSEEIYLRANRAINREMELERNGYRWKAVDVAHRNKRRYDRNIEKRKLISGHIF